MILSFLTFLIFIIILPGSLDLLVLSIGGLKYYLSKKTELNCELLPTLKLIIVIPAHNEESHIRSTLMSLNKEDPKIDCVVIADNCTDSTTSIAQACGVRVIERHDLAHPGKHRALEFAFQILMKEGYEGFIIIDADSIVAPNFTRVITSYLSTTYPILQVRYTVKKSHENNKSRLLSLGMDAANYLQPIARQAWGLSCGILGNGFAILGEVLLDVPFHTRLNVEDAEYHIKLLQKGYKVYFTDTTFVTAVTPPSIQGEVTQRSRWEGGRFRLAYTYLPEMLCLFFKGHLRLFEPCLSLMLLPLSYHTLFILVLLFLHPILGLSLCLILCGYIMMTALLCQASWKDYLAFLGNSSMAVAMFVLLFMESTSVCLVI